MHMSRDDIYKRKSRWVLQTHSLEEDTLVESSFIRPNRRIYLEAIYPANARPYYSNACRFELREEWASFENPEFLVKGRDDLQVGYDKKVRIASFDNLDDGRFILQLLAALLNAPANNPLCHEISPYIMRAFASFPDELAKIDAQEEKEEAERAAKVEAEKKFYDNLHYGVQVYMCQLDNDTVKIGISKNVIQRSSAIEGHSGLKVLRWTCTEGLPAREARQIESDCHSHFGKSRTHREFFAVTFDEACVYLQSRVALPLIQGKTDK